MRKTFDMRRAFEYLAHVKAENLELAEVNRHAFRECIIDGRGIFIDELVRGLAWRGLSVPLFEHDVIDEMDGRAHAVEV
ncbi:MAG: hypothetical protein HY897_10860 [Deltaproteobacteria bacterium]|nr:hypothetical protein [Deltaproteobacteria bacterium]